MDEDFFEFIGLFFLGFILSLFLSFVIKSNFDYAHDNIEEYTQLYNECESNYHTEKTMSHICVNKGHYQCFEYQDKEIDVKVYDVKPNGMSCEEIVSSYNNMVSKLEYEKKHKK